MQIKNEHENQSVFARELKIVPVWAWVLAGVAFIAATAQRDLDKAKSQAEKPPPQPSPGVPGEGVWLVPVGIRYQFIGDVMPALEMAMTQRVAPTGLVHHSDRGVQYASRDYTRRLEEHGIRISMSRTGNPWDNAACESFLKTLKYEEVYRSEYRDLADAYARIGEFLEVVYNQKRLHSALDYRSPAIFEQSLLSSPTLVEVPA